MDRQTEREDGQLDGEEDKGMDRQTDGEGCPNGWTPGRLARGRERGDGQTAERAPTWMDRQPGGWREEVDARRRAGQTAGQGSGRTERGQVAGRWLAG